MNIVAAKSSKEGLKNAKTAVFRENLTSLEKCLLQSEVTTVSRNMLLHVRRALRRSRRAAAADFLVGAPPTQYIEVTIFSWTVL